MMKITQIAAALKKGNNLTVYTNGRAQFLSNGFAVYFASNLPMITSSEQLCTILGITGEQEGKYNIKIGEPLPSVMLTSSDYQETAVEKSELAIKWRGMQYTAFAGGGNIMLVKSQYLAPFKDIDEVTYYDRVDCGKNHFLTVEAGLLGLIGLICPTAFSSQDPMSQELSRLAAMLREVEV